MTNPESPLNGEVIRVLHVDDDASFLEITKLILQDMGNFEIAHALCVDEAFKKLELNKKYDVILSDYEMPQKDGLEFLKLLREGKNMIPFILFTGKGREDVAIKALNLGADGYVNKMGNPETVYGELKHDILQLANQNRIKKEIAQVEEQFRQLFSNIPSAVAVYEAVGDGDDFVFRDFNKAAEIIEKKNKSDVLGKRVTEVFSGVKEFGILEFFQRVWRTGKTEYFPIAFYHDRNDSGSWRENWIIKLPNGNIAAIYNDITERKNALLNLVESEKRYRDLVDCLPEIVFEIDLQGNILFANSKSFEVTGYSQDDFQRGVNVLDIFSPEDKQRAKENLSKAFSETNLKIIEYTLIKKDGTRFPVSAKSIPIVKNGRIIGVRGIVIDLTEYKKNQELLFTLNEKLRVVGGLTRHDVANKLMVVKANLFLLEKSLGDNFELRKYLDGVKSAIVQSAEILNFSKVYEQIGSQEHVEADVGKLFYVATMRLADLKSIQVINECYGLTVVADSFLTQLLLYNLVDNSLKHGERVTQIRLHFEKNKDGVKLFYEDNGVGISAENKFKLFSEGFTTGTGSGLGLKLIKRMIEVYGWIITEEGTPGEGAKFTITIPKESPQYQNNKTARHP